MTELLTTTAPPPALDLPFTPRLPPISHQADFLRDHAHAPAYGLFWEQGTGKTKALIDNAALLAVEGRIDGVLVLAPSGVHLNWELEELPKHWPADAPPLLSFAWSTTRAPTKAFRGEWARWVAASAPEVGRAPGRAVPCVSILCMSYDSLMTADGRKASWDFIRSRRVMIIGDESQRFSAPDAARTKRVVAAAPYGDYRRIASGTPMDAPLDVYPQVRFLDGEFWARELWIGGFTAFRARFAKMKRIPVAGGVLREVIDGYRDLDELHAVVARISSRVLKEDVLDLPPKVYKRVFHELTPAQRRVYEELRAEALSVLDSGELVTAEMALVLQLRLAQVGCGFIKPSPGAEEVPFSPNPRAEALEYLLGDLTRPAIIWGRFRHDVAMAERASRRAGRRPVVYDGARPDDAIEAFRAGRADDIIANLSSNMREGYTLTEADSVIYVSNSPKLRPRLQSEDRAHRIGQGRTVTYYDFLAAGTADARELDRLQAKRDLVGTVLGDDPEVTRAWLRELVEE